MKELLILLFALISFCPVDAQSARTETQESNEISTIFNQTNPIGWWISTDAGWTQLDSRNVFLGGMSGGIIINHSFSVGFAGYGIMNTHNLRYSGIVDTADVYLYGGYGGLKLEYRFNPMHKVNVAFPLVIGGGALAYSTWHMGSMHNSSFNNSDIYSVWDGFFVVEPGVVIGFNLVKFMRLDAGVSYRFSTSIDLPKTAENIMTGFNAGISLKFGKF